MVSMTNKDLRFDILAIGLFIFIAFCIGEGLWQATAHGVFNPYESDLEEYSGRLASIAHPENFARDNMYGHASWTTSFPTMQVWVGEMFPAGDNFNWAMMRQVVPCAILFYLGFYLFGLALGLSRPMAFLFAFAAGIADRIGWGTWWGICSNIPVPRTWFDTAFPWLLWAAFAALERPAWRLVVMFAAGCLAYTHPISALGMGGTLFTAFALRCPKAWAWKRHLYWLVLCGLLFLLPLIPYVLSVLQPKPTVSAEDANCFREMMALNFAQRFGPPFSDLTRFLWYNTVYRPTFAFAAIGAVLVWRFGNSRHKQHLKMCLGLLLGVFLFGACLSWAEQQLAHALGKLSIFHQMIRITRFSVPVCYIMAALGLMAMMGQWGKVRCRFAYLALLFALLISWPYCEGLATYAIYAMERPFGLITEDSRNLEKQQGVHERQREAMLAVKNHVPVNDLVFSNTGDAAIRYFGLRSLAYAMTDGAHLFFQYDADGCRRWLATMKALKTPQGYLEAWQGSDAEWLLTNRPEDESMLTAKGQVVWRNADYLLVKKDMTP